MDSYSVKIPIEVYGQEKLRQVVDAIRGVKGGLDGLSPSMREFVRAAREQADVSRTVEQALDGMRRGAAGAEEGHKRLASALLQYISRAREAEQQSNRLSGAMGRVGGRLIGADIGSGIGVPGLGRLGGTLVGGMGLSGGAMLGVGAGAIAGMAAFKALENAEKSARDVQHLADSLGIAASRAYDLSAAAAIAGASTTALASAGDHLAKALEDPATAGKKTVAALMELGVALVDSSGKLRAQGDVIQDVVKALQGLPNGAEKSALAIQALGAAGRELKEIGDDVHRIAPSDADIAQLAHAADGFREFFEEVKSGAISATAAVLRLFGAGSGNSHKDQPWKWGDPYEDMLDRRGLPPGGADILKSHLAGLSNPLELKDRLGAARSAYERARGAETLGTTQKDLTPEAAAKLKADTDGAAAAYARALADEKAAGAAKRAQDALESFAASMEKSGLGPATAKLIQGAELTKKYGNVRNSEGLTFTDYAILGASQELGKESSVDQSRMAKMNLSGDKANDEFWKGDLSLHTADQIAIQNFMQKVRTGREIRDIGFGADRDNIMRQSSRAGRMVGFSGMGETQGAAATLQIQLGLAQQLYDLDMKKVAAETDGSKQSIDNAKAESDLKKASYDAQLDYEMKLMDIQHQRMEQFSSGFASVFMGAQNGGARGARGALRGIFEGQESTVLQNIGAQIWKNGAGAAAGSMGKGIPDWLKKGTLFEGGGANAPMMANTTATAANTQATVALTAVMARAGGFSAPSGGGIGGIPGIGTFGSDTNGLTGISGLGVGQAGSYGGMDPATASAMGMPTPGASGGGGGFSGLGMTGKIGAIAGLAGGTYAGISSISRGGAKNVTSGVGDLAGVAAGALMLAGVSGPAAPILMGVAAAAGIASIMMGDPKQNRQNSISKSIFTHQYLAPQAEDITVGPNGMYSDVDAQGNVRGSNFSPYPIVQGSYLDVPRRTVVPGHIDASFGGYSNNPGARTPQVPQPRGGGPTYNVTIQAMDSKSFIDNAPHFMDALHHGLSQGYHPVLNTIGSQLGTRG